MPAEIFKVITSFQDADGRPLSGSEYSVTLMDEDRFFDDKLNDSALDPKGNAEFMIYAADIVSIDSMDERTPDLYFIVKKGGKEIFRTDVIPNVDFDAEDPITGRANSTTQTFGPYRLPA